MSQRLFLPRLRLQRALLVACCAFLIAAQIGGFSHAFTHFGPDNDSIAEAAGHAGDHNEHGKFFGCVLDLSFGALGHALAGTPQPAVAPGAAEAVAAAAAVVATPAFVAVYRSRAPPHHSS